VEPAGMVLQLYPITTGSGRPFSDLNGGHGSGLFHNAESGQGNVEFDGMLSDRGADGNERSTPRAGALSGNGMFSPVAGFTLGSKTEAFRR
jgi:hypothetical protein